MLAFKLENVDLLPTLYFLFSVLVNW